MNLREAAQAALEALESLQGGCTDSGDGTFEAITVWCPEVIEPLRAALAQKQEPVAWQAVGGSIWSHKTCETDRPLYDAPVSRHATLAEWWAEKQAAEQSLCPHEHAINDWRLHNSDGAAPQPAA